MIAGFINSGLQAGSSVLKNLSDLLGSTFDNEEKKRGLFESGLTRARLDRQDAQFRRNEDSGLDPLRNSLSLFRNADNIDDAVRGLGAFTALRQPAASASLFDRNAVGIPGLAGSATGLIGQGFGGLNAAFGLEQQNLALRLSEIGNRALNLNNLSAVIPQNNFNTAGINEANRAALAPIIENFIQNGFMTREQGNAALSSSGTGAPGSNANSSTGASPAARTTPRVGTTTTGSDVFGQENEAGSSGATGTVASTVGNSTAQDATSIENFSLPGNVPDTYVLIKRLGTERERLEELVQSDPGNRITGVRSASQRALDEILSKQEDAESHLTRLIQNGQ